MLTSISPNIPPEYMEYVNLNVGKIDKSKTFIDQIKNYEKNTTVDVVYGFFNPKPRNAVDAVADERYTFAKVRHLFVQMPDDEFEPRVADQRVGYFSQKVTDLSSYKYVNAIDLINKWRLIKKDPSLEVSEPVKPLVFWVENSTPEEIIPFVVEGIEAWNIAFEKQVLKMLLLQKYSQMMLNGMLVIFNIMLLDGLHLLSHNSQVMGQALQIQEQVSLLQQI